MDDGNGRANPDRLKRDIYIAAGLTVVAFVVALFFIVQRASFVANGIALEADFKLIAAEVERQRKNAEWDMNQATLSLDGLMTMQRKGMTSELELMGPVLAHYIAEDGMQQLLVVDADNAVTYAMKDGEAIDDPSVLPLSEFVAETAERARDNFEAVRPNMPEGWEYDRPVKNDRQLYALGEFATLDGHFGLVMSQVILPWTPESLTAGRDVPVHVSFRPLEKGDLAESVKRLNITGFEVVAAEVAPNAEARFDVAAHDGSPAFALLWNQPDPRRTILLAVLPLGVALSCAIAALLGIMLRRYRFALSDLAASEERNHRLANHDALTGLANRAQFDARLENLIEMAPREGFAVMCIDLDKFKAVNDTHGHNAGDAVLVAAANRFAEIVGDQGIVARVGGDEFVVLVTASTAPPVLKMLGESLIAAASLPVEFEGVELTIGASIGVSIWPIHGRQTKDIIHAADQVLYDSKRAGRGRCSIVELPATDAGGTEAA